MPVHCQGISYLVDNDTMRTSLDSKDYPLSPDVLAKEWSAQGKDKIDATHTHRASHQQIH